MKNDPFFLSSKKRLSYKKAHNIAPKARHAELEAVLKLMGEIPIRRTLVLEIGSGLGFLTSYLAQKGFALSTVDPYIRHGLKNIQHFLIDPTHGLYDLCKKGYKYDYIVSLVSLHHMIHFGEQSLSKCILQAMKILLKKKGKLILMDVMNQEMQDSKPFRSTNSSESVYRTHQFFLRVVDIHARPPHQGSYACPQSICSALADVGFSNVRYVPMETPWVFDSELLLGQFVKAIFHLEINYSTVIKLASSIVGVKSIEEQTTLEWGLGGIICEK